MTTLVRTFFSSPFFLDYQEFQAKVRIFEWRFKLKSGHSLTCRVKVAFLSQSSIAWAGLAGLFGTYSPLFFTLVQCLLALLLDCLHILDRVFHCDIVALKFWKVWIGYSIYSWIPSSLLNIFSVKRQSKQSHLFMCCIWFLCLELILCVQYESLLLFWEYKSSVEDSCIFFCKENMFFFGQQCTHNESRTRNRLQGKIIWVVLALDEHSQEG